MRIGLITLTDTNTVLDLASVLSEIGQTVTIYFSKKSSVRFDNAPGNFIENLYIEEIIPHSCNVKLYDFPRMSDLSSVSVVRQICRDMYNDRLDVVHILMGPAEPWLAVLAKFLSEIPVVSTIIVPSPNVGDPLRVWVEPINRLQISGSDLVVVNGANQVDSLQKQYKIPPDQIVHIPLGPRITAVKWLREDTVEQPGTILFFGRADSHKGLEYLIRAQPLITQQVPSAKILIVAHGDELIRCRALIQDESVFEIHEGVVSNEAMARFFARASLVALPYLSASTSGVLLTAYGFGKPVVATSVGSLPEYVDDGLTGLLVPPSRVEPFANALIRLLLDDDLRCQMGSNARRWVEEEKVKNAFQTINAYEKAISIYQERQKGKRANQDTAGTMSL